jgi:hypothetical protein
LNRARPEEAPRPNDEGNRQTDGFGFISFMSFTSHESAQQSCFSEDMFVVVPVVFV